MSTSLSSVPAQTGKYLENWKLNLGISIASLTLSTVVLILVLVKQSYPPLNTLEEATRNPSTLEPVCLDCVQVVTYSQPPYLTETLFNQLRIHIKDGHKQCCFNSTDLIRILVELVSMICFLWI
ncbi:unnamed protein product [Lymnaea stagnalis]|uniref:Uncharacterized protein n=1 Tax=Lymnaea stagnalis TaxID=6523 RepID=A0AAV2I226_LYMST